MAELPYTEKLRIINSFPASLRKDAEEVVKVLASDSNVILANGKAQKLNGLIHSSDQMVIFNGEPLIIPGRYYFNEPAFEKEKLLTPLQRTILNCIYLRHHNGFVRQKRLELLGGIGDNFVIPYTFQLLGEYVVEILEILDQQITNRTIGGYIHFISENKKYAQQTESRMISYWNEYYRRPGFPQLEDYVGKKIFDRIKQAHRE